MESHRQACDCLKQDLESLTENCSEIQGKIDSIPAELIDIANITKQIRHKENQVTSLLLKVGEDEETLKIKQGLYERVIEFIDNFEFEKYQKYPEYQKLNQDMTLSQFKLIFFWEYVHRLIGRLLGIFFIIPFAYFLIKN